MRWLRVGAIAIGVVFPLGFAAQEPRRFAGKLTKCELPGSPGDSAYCGRHAVFENREARAGRRIELNIMVLPATTGSVASDAVVFLAGGGVVPATRYARFLAGFAELRKHRDILLVDQRGTGASNPLVCDRATLDTANGLPPDERYLRYISACHASLTQRADVRFYATTNAMADLEDVRGWLGYSTLNLYGASYGTSAAQTYAKLHPDRVRTIVMHGVVPLDVPMQVDLARSAQQSLDRVLDMCANDSACRSAFPDIRGDLAAVMRGNPSQPFREALNGALAAVPGIRNVPLMIHGAATGSLPPPGGAPGGPDPAPLGVRLAILCSEGVSAIDTAAIASSTSNTFLGDFPVRFQLRWCDGWPTAPLPPTFREPFRSSTPALLLTGELDPITPPSYAEHVAERLDRSTALRLPNKSHSDTDACVTTIIEQFIVSGGATPDASCLASTPSVLFVTEGVRPR
jgi:pimeloyl-ACP methyl ester carboxylesterase